LLLGCDIGGTFTDFVYLDEDGLRSFKLPSTPQRPELAISDGLSDLPSPPTTITHGTTLATNAILERRGQKTALITTAGFEDILFIGSQKRTRLYDLNPSKPAPLIPRDLCYGVPERLGPKGEVLVPLDEHAVNDIADDLKRKGVVAIAVSLLFSFLDPTHEKRVKEILEGVGDWRVSVSSEVLPLFREYPRTSTTVLDSYIGPLIASYLHRLGEVLRSVGDPTLFIMQSNGGVVAPAIMERRPVTSILSGPAGGVAAAEHLANLIGIGDLLTLDMGGTSTDVSCLQNGRPEVFSSGVIQGLPVAVPMVDIEIVGAGGGSIAHVDEGGVLKVGPMSAGASPGPVCYGQGGTRFTITDADLLCGYLSPESFLGGKMTLHTDRALKSAQTLADTLRTPIEDVLTGVQSVVHAEMVRALRRVSVEKGVDPRDLTLLVFGGAGPVHGAYVARDLGITTIVVPPSPGTFSALGMLLSPVRLTYSQSIVKPALKSIGDVERSVNSVLDEFQKRAQEEVSLHGLPTDKMVTLTTLALRYKGQSFQLRVPYEGDLSGALEAFCVLHESLYGFRMDQGVGESDVDIEVVDVSLVVSVERKGSPFPQSYSKKGDPGTRTRKAVFQEGGMECNVFSRERLGIGHSGTGPAIIEEGQSTTVVPPGCSFDVNDLGCIYIRWDGA